MLKCTNPNVGHFLIVTFAPHGVEYYLKKWLQLTFCSKRLRHARSKRNFCVRLFCGDEPLGAEC